MQIEKVHRRFSPRAAAACVGLCLTVVGLGCSGGHGDAPDATKRAAMHAVTDSSGGTVDLAGWGRAGGTAYRVARLERPGAVVGTIRLEGVSQGDTGSSPTDQHVCGASTRGLASAVHGVSSAIVWIADVSAGRSLPVEKRFELTSEDCRVDPRIEAAVVGSTFDVYNDDRTLHRLIFLRFGTSDTLTVMPFFNGGQMVASERVAAQPGLVEIRCAFHPWTRGYVAVFGNPYFAVTNADGGFKIDSLPAGAYTVMVWHEGLTTPLRQRITVPPGGEAKIDMAVPLTEH